MKQNMSEMYYNRNVNLRYSDKDSQFPNGLMAKGEIPIPEFQHEEDTGENTNTDTDLTSHNFDMRPEGGTDIYITEAKESTKTRMPNQTAPENEYQMNQT
jgi:hypothetical protein